ncbi:enoyl-CoA hydratase-related protein [Conexibacter sp. SYSU D00693]|uniref:enoyl-CoA hydratase-related protein n=1 Tax=Conexibacter sp. SYSU D00693 TaxID=2812560 RepID=UPI00196B4D78|nr:enoyl-CoA hydratase-related protein [Conexibacter sp. SYSU D00693]
MAERSDDVLVQRDGAVAHLQLNRPEALNAWTPDMGRALLAALRDAGTDPGVRAVLVTGAGRGFCAGADVKVPRELLPDGAPDLHTRLEEIYNPVVLEVRRMPKPVVAAVHGPAAGLGVSLAAACDLVVAADSATFLLAFVHIAVMPDGGVLGHLAAKVGAGRAAELAMLGERLPAARAHAWGLVQRLVADDELHAEGLALAQRLAAMPTTALASIKEVLDRSRTLALEDAVALEAQVQQRHATTADYAEGVAAFKEKRRPRFVGR